MRHLSLLLALILAVPSSAANKQTNISVPVLPVAPLAAQTGPAANLTLGLPSAALGTPKLAIPAAASASFIPSLPQAAVKAAAFQPGAAAKAQVTTQQALAALGEKITAAASSGKPGQVSASIGQAFDGSAAKGEVQTQGVTKRDLYSIDTLKLGTYNVLNLFEKVGKHVPDPSNPGKLMKVSQAVLKEDWALREQAKVIKEADLDVVVLQEVENIKALKDFNDQYLGGLYEPLLIEGNDERGIDVAYLVKKDLPFELEHRTHKDETWTDPIIGGGPRPLFSRDLPQLIVRRAGSDKPLFVMFGTHFKSKRDRPGDPESRIVAKAQAERAAEIVERARKEFGADVPIMLAGDFNGDLNAEDTFDALLKKAGLRNSLDLGDKPVPLKDRVTHTYHPRVGPAHKAQMDAITVSKSLEKHVKRSWVYRYKDAQGREKPIPDTYDERSKNPSDHFPLLVNLEFQPLVKRTEPQDALAQVGPALQTQSYVLSGAAKALGTDMTTLSMILSLTTEGISLADWMRLEERFRTLEAGPGEISAAGAKAVSQWSKSKPIRDDSVDREALETIAFALKEADQALVIARNNDFLKFASLWERGDVRVAKTSFAQPRAFRDGDDLHLALGSLRLTLTLNHGFFGDASKHLDDHLGRLLKSPFAKKEHREAVASLLSQAKALLTAN